MAVLGDLDACRRVAYENVEDAANAGLHYAELRFSPYYMAMKHQLPVAGVVEAVIDGIRSGCRDRDIDIRLIGIMSRTFGEAACLQELEGLLAHRDGITALDLAGDELGFPGSLFLNHFNRARDAGLRITVHAGEAAGPESIWQAIRELGAERIGHGVKAVEDPALMEFLAEHGIGIESCLTSNIQTSTVPSLAQHPLATFLRHGVLASINTDDPAVQGIEIEHEYRVAAPQAGLTPEEIRTAQENGLKLAFLSEQENRRCAPKFRVNSLYYGRGHAPIVIWPPAPPPRPAVWRFYAHSAARAPHTHQLHLVENHQRQHHGAHRRSREQHVGHRDAVRQALFEPQKTMVIRRRY